MKHTDEQCMILDSTASFRVLAGAGSGKTTTMAMYVEKAISQRNIQERNICFLTFTRFAAQQIRDRVHRYVGRKHHIVCGTFHKTIFGFLKESGAERAPSKLLYDGLLEETISYFLDLLRNASCPRLISILQRFRLLIVDEFQDLDASQFEFLTLWKQIQPDLQLIAIGDLGQNIYRFRGTSNEFLRKRILTDIDPHMKTFQLTTNFRSTAPILACVNALFSHEIREKVILPMVCPADISVSTMKPRYYEYSVNPGKGMGEYEEYVVETLLPILLRAKRSGQSAVLIFPILKCQSYQLTMALLRQKSKEHGFSFDIHQITKEDETCVTIEFSYNPKDMTSPIQCSTIHSAKGLEWDIVALINITDDMYSIRGVEDDCEAFVAEKTNLLYVGVTRAVCELYIFANANCGGRHRILGRLKEEELGDILDITMWGDEIRERDSSRRLQPMGVTELIRKLPQHPDIFATMRACSERVVSIPHDGHRMVHEDIYHVIKQRNREMAVGTFLDWKLKQVLCTGTSRSLQDCIVELSTRANVISWWFHKNEAFETNAMRLAKLEVFFANVEDAYRTNVDGYERYVAASRYLSLFYSKMFAMIPACRNIYRMIETRIQKAYCVDSAGNRDLEDEFVVSQVSNFFGRSKVDEILSVDAPSSSYQGLPDGFETFIESCMEGATEVIRSCIASLGISMDHVIGDFPLSSESILMGEADLVVVGEKTVLVEIKCSSAYKALDMREPGCAKHLLQVFAYVALGRHGAFPLEVDVACIVNPLTGAWELYDMTTWSHDDSLLFLRCMEDIRERV